MSRRKRYPDYPTTVYRSGTPVSGDAKPQKECGGCKKRKAALNAVAPRLKLGDQVEAFTKATGIKQWWDDRYGDDPNTQEKANDT